VKLTEHFDAFLADVVNLNSTRIDVLETRVGTIEQFLRNSDFRPKALRFSPQGSWAVKTIIKPPNGADFDADELVFVEPIVGWEPEDYINELRRVFHGSDRYRKLLQEGTRCVTLDYKNDFHLDIVICLRFQKGNRVHYAVCNAKANTFEVTDGEGFALWFAERNSITGDNMLRKVTRLLKYLRDIKGTFSAKSIVLATLLGNTVEDWHSQVRSLYYGDVPTALKTIVGHLDDWLQARPLMPTVTNPVLPIENFNRHWDQEKYENFRYQIHRYREWINDAFGETDRDQSIAKWRRVFGEDFARGEIAGKATAVAGTALQVVRATSSDLVTAVRRLGPALLDRIPANLPWVSPPEWPSSGRATVNVRATAYSEQGSGLIGEVRSGQVLPKGIWLHFSVRVPSGMPRGWQIKWRVVNSGEEALAHSSLRGRFEKSGSDGGRWEKTSYLGVHWVEAFLINTRDRSYAGKSARFFVVISSEHAPPRQIVA
jgi:hypothetical protein